MGFDSATMKVGVFEGYRGLGFSAHLTPIRVAVFWRESVCVYIIIFIHSFIYLFVYLFVHTVDDINPAIIFRTLNCGN